MRVARRAMLLSFCALAAFALAGLIAFGAHGAAADSSGTPKLREIEDALSGLPDNAAWQGVANDGTYWYLLTSISPEPPPRRAENIIRKYRISDGQLVAEQRNAYRPGGQVGDDRQFSSGEVIDGKLYVAVRDGSVASAWAHIAVYDTADLSQIDDFDIAHDGYTLPEGVAKHLNHFWVVFGGRSENIGNGNKFAVLRYDEGWNWVASYDLKTLAPGAGFGGQDILWISDDEILTNMHEDGLAEKAKLDRWRWTGAGFDLVTRYDQLDDDAQHKLGQGFTRLGDYLYFAARYSDRLVKAELVDPPPTTPTPCPDNDGDTLCDETDLDDDNDGCTDKQELGSDPTAGGLRDPHSYWDYADMPNPNATPQRDGMVRISDVTRVLARHGEDGDPNADPLSTPPKTGYHPAYDRGQWVGPHPWDVEPPNGTIRIADIIYVLNQYGHECS